MLERVVRFLLVDDLEENLLALEALLRRDGLELLRARAGPEALEMLLVHEVDLVVLDVQMPGMDGFEVAELMRGTERTRRVPIIFVTAGASDNQRRFRGYELGAVDFLFKPIDPHILRSKADIFFELARQRHELQGIAEAKARLLQERTEAERLARQSEAHTRRVLDNLFAFVGVLTPDATLVQANRAPLEAAGVPGSEVFGKKFWDCVWWNYSPEIQEQLRQACHRAASGEVVRYDVPIRVAGDKRLWIDFQIAPLRDDQGRITHLIPSAMDISVRKEAEKELQKQSERIQIESEMLAHLLAARDPQEIVRGTFQKVAAHLGVDTWLNYLLDADGEVLRLHASGGLTGAQAETFLQLQMGQALCGTSAALRQPIILHDLQQSTDPKAAGLKSIGIRAYVCHPLMFGERLLGTLSFAARGRDAFAPDEIEFLRTVSQFVAVAMDRVQQERALQQAKEDLQRINENLEHTVQERTARLRETVAELEHFSYTITHDMRAPLRAMRGLSSIVLEECATDLHPERAEYLRRIADSAERMDKLITDALQYALLVRGQFTLEPVDTGALLRGMLESYPQFRGFREHIRVENDLPVVFANKAGLTQCFSNLLGNALKFVPPGKTPDVTIRSAAAGHDREGGDQPDSSGAVRIYFEDRGIGIDKQYQERIWNMFQRLNNRYDGTGIGLALVRKAVERMGGRAGVESEPGRGSRFWLELRTAPDASEDGGGCI